MVSFTPSLLTFLWYMGGLVYGYSHYTMSSVCYSILLTLFPCSSVDSPWAVALHEKNLSQHGVLQHHGTKGGFYVPSPSSPTVCVSCAVSHTFFFLFPLPPVYQSVLQAAPR